MISPRRYDWVLHLSTIALCSYFVAQSVTICLAGLIQAETPVVTGEIRQISTESVSQNPMNESEIEDASIIVERNLFNSKDIKLSDTGAAGSNAQQLGALGEAIKTALDLKIGSTLRVGDGTDKRSSAFIAVGKAKGKAYFVGDEESFAPGVKLIKVRRRRIEFINSGRLEYAELDESKKSVFVSADEAFGNTPLLASASSKVNATATNTSSSAGTIQVNQSEVDNALQNLDQLQREVRIVPNFQGGKSAGFKVLAVKPGGFVSKLGVRRGDVLVKVNGEDLDIRRGLELFGSLKDSRSFALEVLRGGQTQTLEYEIR